MNKTKKIIHKKDKNKSPRKKEKEKLIYFVTLAELGKKIKLPKENYFTFFL